MAVADGSSLATRQSAGPAVASGWTPVPGSALICRTTAAASGPAGAAVAVARASAPSWAAVGRSSTTPWWQSRVSSRSSRDASWPEFARVSTTACLIAA